MTEASAGHGIAVRTLRLSEDDPAAFDAALSPEERARAERYLQPADRDRFRLGRGLLRLLLGEALGRPPRRIALQPDACGKPALDEPAGLAFSVSHSGDLVAVALGRVAAVGIDVERRRRDLDPLALAPHAMTAREIAAIAAAEDRHAAFLDLWVRKEALLKGLGSGLLADPRGVDVLPAPGGAAIAFAPGSAPARAGDWRLHPLDLAPGYHAALAVLPPRPAGPAAPRLGDEAFLISSL